MTVSLSTIHHQSEDTRDGFELVKLSKSCLTVNTVDEEKLSVALIPHTVDMTTLADRRPGAKLNLEVDMIGKYVEKLVQPYQK